jgi:hypothetical protein
MKRQTSVARDSAGLLLALIGLMTGFIVPAHCQDRSPSALGAKASATLPSWVHTGNLNIPRHSHTATLLPNGNVLAVGGFSNAFSSLDSAELYDTAAGTWSVTGSLNSVRVFHTATLLQNGKVLVAGGFVFPTIPAGLPNFTPVPSPFRLSSSELYDPATGTWSPTGSLAATHAEHTATLLPNGKVLIGGGTSDDFSIVHNAELYDPAAGTWGPAASPNTFHFAHTATLLQNGNVLVAGGRADAQGDFDIPVPSRAELYDPVSSSWREVGTAIIIGGHTATLLPNAKVLVAGGSVVSPITPRGAELYDPAAEMLSYTGNLNVGRYGHTATLLPNGKVLVAGGDGGDLAELYDPESAIWTSTSILNAGRFSHTATLLPNGNVLVAGGRGAQNALNSAELYGEVGLPLSAIGAGFTGAWYDPTQSGHGLFIEVLPNNRFFAGWFTFNPAGTQQAWFVGVGTYSGTTATITAVALPTGGRWIPNFDPNQIVNNLWGTLTFSFTDCNHGKVDFNSALGYGTGSMNLTRLTLPPGPSCP